MNEGHDEECDHHHQYCFDKAHEVPPGETDLIKSCPAQFDEQMKDQEQQAKLKHVLWAC